MLWCRGFSLQWLLSLPLLLLQRTGSRLTASAVAARRSTQAPLLQCMCLVALWHIRSFQTRTESASPPLAGGFLTTGPPRKSSNQSLILFSLGICRLIIICLSLILLYFVFLWSYNNKFMISNSMYFFFGKIIVYYLAISLYKISSGLQWDMKFCSLPNFPTLSPHKKLYLIVRNTLTRGSVDFVTSFILTSLKASRS